jgi:predicted AAA+ superfamily ATPase
MKVVPFANSADALTSLRQVDSELHNRNTPVIIVGVPGTGKTTMLQMFEEDHRDYYTKISYLHGFRINGRNDLSLMLEDIPSRTKNLLIIDGFDEIVDKDTLRFISQYIQRYSGKRLHVLLSQRSSDVDKLKLKEGVAFKLEPWSEKEAMTYLLEMISANDLKFKNIKDLQRIVSNIPKTPGEINRLFDLLGDNVPLPEIIKSFDTPIDFLNPNASPQKIILPEHNQIITNAANIEKNIIDRIKQDFAEVWKISPRQFEELVAELYRRLGYHVYLTPQTRDGGKDIILSQFNETGKSLYYVECKQLSLERKVAVSVVDRLHGVVTREKATKGIIVTTSSFSPTAIIKSQDIEHQMSLIDHAELHQFIKRVTR